jgi:hypothetical protein
VGRVCLGSTIGPDPTAVAHVISAVTDDGSPSLTPYRRGILRVRAKPDPE